jgi:hypothetical protein
MKEFLFDLNSVLIVAALSIFMVLAIEGGYRVGARREGKADESFKSHVDSIAGALLGILALLLGFTLSLRCSVTTAAARRWWMKPTPSAPPGCAAQMLPAALRGEAQALLRDYTDLRVHASTLTLADHARTSGR